MRRIAPIIVLLCLAFTFPAFAQEPSASPSSQPTAGKLPHIQVDTKKKQIRVECEVLNLTVPLEFFCVVSGTSDHETVLRTLARPSHLHLALLMLGLEPGEPVHYSKAADKWLPPHGPPLHISVEFMKDGRLVSYPANRLMRNTRTKKEMPPLTWIFAGSRVMEGGTYAADSAGYLVSIVNFDLTVIDIPALASSDNETLEWETNLDLIPPAGTKVWMVIEPAGSSTPVPSPTALAPSPATTATTNPLSDITINQSKIDALHKRWEQAVAPHKEALREAAQAHYEMINALRREQQRLINEADRVQRVIEQLEKEYQDMTTPHPEISKEPKE